MNYKSYKEDVFKALGEAKDKSYELVGESARTGVVDRITKQEQVDTGYMRNATDYEVKKESVIIGNAAEYAPFQNKKKPFLKEGVYDVMTRIEKVVQAVMKEYFR